MTVRDNTISKWLLNQTPAVVIAILFSYGFWILIHENDDQHKIEMQETHKRYIARIQSIHERNDRMIDAYGKAYKAISTVISDIDKRMSVMSADIQVLNGRSRIALSEIRSIEKSGEDKYNPPSVNKIKRDLINSGRGVDPGLFRGTAPK